MQEKSKRTFINSGWDSSEMTKSCLLVKILL